MSSNKKGRVGPVIIGIATIYALSIPSIYVATSYVSQYDAIRKIHIIEGNYFWTWALNAAPIFIVACLTLAIPTCKIIAKNFARDRTLWIYVIIFFCIFLSSLISTKFISFTYSVIFLIYLLLFFIFFRTSSNNIRKTLLISGIISIFSIVYAWSFGTPPSARFIGPIHPNLAGGIAVFIFLVSITQGRKLALLLATFAFLVAVYTSSRYAILFILLASAFTVSLTYRDNPALSRQLKVVAAAALFLTIVILEILSDSGLFVELFELNDRMRGWGSGISGRADLWHFFAPQVEMISGFGFRNREGYIGVHSGLLNFALELGIALFVVSLASIGFLINKVFSNSIGSRARRIDVFGANAMLAWIIIAIFQPQVVSFGDVSGLIFFFGFACLLQRPSDFPIGTTSQRTVGHSFDQANSIGHARQNRN